MLTFYEQKRSWFADLNPITKLYFVGVMFLIPFLTDNLLILTSYFLLILALAYSSKIFNRFCNTLTRIILPLLILLFIMQSLLYPGGEKIICQIWFMSVKQEGVIFASTIGLRLLIVIGSILVFLITTHPKDMIMALEQKGVPSAIGYIVLSTMQIIPHMEMMSKRILDAQKSRGVEVEGNIWVRAKAYLPVVVPLILSSIAQLENKVMALECRAFNAPVKKTSMVDFTLTGADRFVRIIVILILVAAVVGRVASLWL
ncbi:MAG TPA: energy-coupling factor transporter transmembrane component T [Syntrophomonadaceae bacterium]|nr:energy-coupling factor transporter transmembrane component T [Syntrophomonadaceae bacterium]